MDELTPGGDRESLPMPFTEDDWREVRGGNRVVAYVFAVALLTFGGLIVWAVAMLLGGIA